MRVAAQQQHWLSKYKDAQIKRGLIRREAWGRGPGTLHRPNVPMWMRPLFAFFALLRFSSAARDDFSIAPAPSNDYWRLDGKTALVTGS